MLAANSLNARAVISLLFLTAGSLLGQNPSDASPVVSPSRGFNPDSVYSLGESDNIDMASGNLTLTVPIVSLPPGRASLSTGLALTYSSKLWETDPSRPGTAPEYWYYLIQPLFEGGWQYGIDYTFTPASNLSVNQISSCFQYPMAIIFPDASRHPMYNAMHNGAFDCINWYSLDGSFLRLVMKGNGIFSSPWMWTLYFPDGSQVAFDPTGASFPDSSTSFPIYETITDRNGNIIEHAKQTFANGDIQTYIRDAAYRQITIDQNGSTNIDTITAPGPNNTNAYPACPVPAPPNEQNCLTWTVNWEQVVPNATYIYSTTQTQPTATIPSLGAISSISLPDGLKYSFLYGGQFGEVSSMTTPLGATTTFTYSLDSWTTTPTWINVMFNGPASKQVTYANQYSPSHTTTESWSYSLPTDISGNCTNAQSSVEAPDGGITTNTFVTLAYRGIPCAGSGLISSITRPDGSVVERNWQANVPFRAAQEYTGTSTATLDPPSGTFNNPFIEEELRSDTNAALAPVLTSSTRSTQDKNGNLRGQTSYDYAPYLSLHSAGAPTFGSGNVGGVLHTLNRVMQFSAPDSADTITNSTAVYTETTASTLFELPQSETTGGLQTTSYTYDGNGNVKSKTIGSPSAQIICPGNASSVVCSTYDYDSNGNKIHEFDPKSVETIYTYGSISCTVGSINSLYPTLIQQAAGTSVELDSSYTYDCNNGQVHTATDPNHVQTTNTYSSASPYFGRIESNSVAGQETQYSYDDTNRIVTIKRDVANLGDGQNVTLDSYDELGRPWLTQQFESASDTSGIKVETQYPFSSAGRFRIVTNPFRAATPTSSTEDTMGWHVTAYDKVGRVTSITHYSGAAEPPAWPAGNNSTTTGQATNVYDADTTALRRKVTVTDEAQNSKWTYYDAASRLVQIYEDPNSLQYMTCYGFDALDDLTQVQQQGTTTNPSSGCTAPVLTRTFNYDALKRLTSATNPESGTTQFTSYDGNSNLLTRIDANSITTTFQYDKLNRITDKHYSTGNPGDSVFCYDGDTATSHSGSPDWSCAGAPSTGTNLKGRMTMTSNPASNTQYSAYDSWGRVQNSQQNTQNGYAFSYTYNAAGDLLTETYPNTSRIVGYGYDYIGRAASVTASAGAMNANYASIPQSPTGYAAQGAIQQMTLGGLIEQTCFNPRLQTITIRQASGTPSGACGSGGTDVLRLSYRYSATANNGNVAWQTIQYPSATFTQSYSTYDGVNRLVNASETGPGTSWSQKYDYDYAGNHWVDPNTNLSFGLTLGATLTGATPTAGGGYTNNRMYFDSATYDLAGNQTQIGAYGFQYDAENRMTSSTINGGTANYTYDAQGQRVMKQSGGTTTTYVYDANGELAQEYTSGTSSVAPLCYTCYLMADHLGSTRLMLDGSGNPKEKHDYLPFGEEIPSGIDGRDSTWGGSDPRQKFTGKERDAESALDWFETRYLSSAQGRFTSPDEPFAGWDQHDPQSFNLYSYVENNPLRNTDPDGRDCVAATNQTQTSVTVTVTSGNCSGNAANQTYVAGTVNMGSLTYNGTSIGFSYTSYDPNTTLGAGTVNLGPAPSDALSASAQQILGQAGTRASDGSVIRGGALWMAQFLAMLEGGGGEPEGGVVIGKMPDLEAPGGVRPGESQLDLPNLGNPKANWAQNSGRLRQAMAEGKPIRDASAEPLVNGRPANNTGFLRAERNLLENHGWTYSGGYWNPPAK